MVGSQGNLVEAHGIHEVEIGTVVVEILHFALLKTNGVELHAGVDGVGKHATGFDVAHLHANERAALARLNMLEFGDDAHFAVIDDAHAVLEIGSRNSCHRESFLFNETIRL